MYSMHNNSLGQSTGRERAAASAAAAAAAAAASTAAAAAAVFPVFAAPTGTL